MPPPRVAFRKISGESLGGLVVSEAEAGGPKSPRALAGVDASDRVPLVHPVQCSTQPILGNGHVDVVRKVPLDLLSGALPLVPDHSRTF